MHFLIVHAFCLLCSRVNNTIIVMFWELLILLGTVLLVRFHLYRRHMMEGLHHLPVVQWNLPLIGACYRFLFNSTERTC